MATELFINQHFSKEMILAGKSLIQQLDSNNAAVYAAFWILESKESFWKLVIISPLVETEGPLQYFKRINYINHSFSNNYIISLHNIELANTRSHIFNVLLNLKNSILQNNLNTRLGANFWNGVYFEDMYIYRLSNPNVE